MSTDASRDASLHTRKIFPRNLTARAATMVRGNPANARPESGVDNTHPGLEFDQRNLDQAFFPGLLFEYQFLTGARLVGVNPDLLVSTAVTPADIGSSDENSLHLLYLLGRFGANPGQPRVAQLFGMDGYEVLRTVRDLEPGPLMLVVGRKLPSNIPTQLPMNGMTLMQYGGVINDALSTGQIPAVPLPPVRDKDGTLLAAMLIGDRAEFLDQNGVIQPGIIEPGGLTRSLCAPWQWDFADCGCHYWAANKPDIVFGETGDEQFLNFQRNRDKRPPAVPASNHADWIAGEMTQPDMIRRWETLPFVIAERETSSAPRPVVAQDPNPWTRARVISELSYLATIEHALAIEYLYAYYSLDAPRSPPAAGSPQQAQDVFTAAQTVRSIAVDEMRHFRWANEALQLLDADICLDRATAFTEAENKISGTFNMLPLTPDRLDYFIAVEAPSKAMDAPDQLDGLYTHLLQTLASPSTEIEPVTARKIAEIVKMIIDEGYEHWERFRKVKALLAPYAPASYLRVNSPPTPRADPITENLTPDPATVHTTQDLDLADQAYQGLLAALRVAFEAQPADRAQHITDARQIMYNLDDVGVELAERGIGMRFTLAAPTSGHTTSKDDLLDLLLSTKNTLQLLANREDPATQALIARQRARISDVVLRLGG